MLASKRGVYLPKLVLVPKRQPGIQMDLNSSELSEEVQKLIKRNSVKKIIYHVKTKNVPVNYEVEMYDNEKDTTNVYSGYTRYEVFYCSEEKIINFITTYFSSLIRND